MKRLLLFVCAMAVLLLTCSKKSTGPVGPQPPVRTPFEISYTADLSRSLSKQVAADVGGSVQAYDGDSVAFTLSIPAHALPSDTVITITPLSSLSIGGPGGDSCPACTGSDILCCYHGALFEPSGLILDSAMTLTVSFPLGAPMPFANHPLIAFLDSSGNRCEAAYTEFDTVANTISAHLIHFSGYFVDDGRYDRLEEEVYEAAERLTAAIGTDGFYICLWPIINLQRTCSTPIIYMGDTIEYPDLAASIEKITLDAYTRHAGIISDKSFTQPLCDAISDLYPCFMNIDNLTGFSNFGEFGPINGSLRSDYIVFVTNAANEGHRLCEADSCDQGMELLACAHEAIRLSWYSQINFDPDFCASVNNWMLACQCGINVSIYADKEVVHKIAVSESDAENCIVRYSAGVHNNATNEPAQGVIVDFIELNYPVGSHQIGSGVTDIDGRCEIIAKGSDFDTECGANLVQRVFAIAIYNSEQYISDTVSVTVRPLKIAVTISFSASHELISENIPGYYEKASGSITGTITGPGDWIWAPMPRTDNEFSLVRTISLDSSCWEGGFFMNWSMEFADPRVPATAVGRLLSPKSALCEVAGYATDTTVLVEGTSISVWMVTRIWTHLNFLSMPYAIEQSGVTMGESYCDTTFYGIFGGGYGWYCFELPTPYGPFSVINGACEPYTHLVDTLGKQSTTTITVAPVF